MDNLTRPLSIVICLLALLQATPVLVQSWRYSDGEIVLWKNTNPPRLISRPLEADLDADGYLERVILDGTRVMITRVREDTNKAYTCIGEPLWESPPGWRVKQAVIGDLDHDHLPEVTLLVWRPFEPWPIDRYIPSRGRINEFQTQDGMSSHIIMLGWKNGKFREVWAGSAMVRPFLAFSAGDVNGDGYDELVGIESSYTTSLTAPGNILSIWEWNGFGFTRLGRVRGTFRDVGMAQSNTSESIILTFN
jgi:hypothetical protein